MPVVKIVGWDQNNRPSVSPDSLVAFLKAEAGMDSIESKEAASSLTRGKVVEVYFDFGENEAARDFSTKLDFWGLKANIQSDKELEKSKLVDRVRAWAAPILFLGVAIVGTIIQEPLYGYVLLVLAIGGIAVFFMIRSRSLRR